MKGHAELKAPGSRLFLSWRLAKWKSLAFVEGVVDAAFLAARLDFPVSCRRSVRPRGRIAAAKNFSPI